VGGLFRGYWAANAAWWPWNALYFIAYEHAREALADATGVATKEALSPRDSALCATARAAGEAAAEPVAAHALRPRSSQPLWPPSSPTPRMWSRCALTGDDDEAVSAPAIAAAFALPFGH